MATPPSPPPLTLLSWGAGFGLPSICPECLHALALLRFSGTAFTLDDRGARLSSPSAVLPAVLLGARAVAGARAIAAALAGADGRLGARELDAGLSAAERAETAAFSALVLDGLYPAELCQWWLQEERAEATSAAFGGRAGFPLGLVVQGQLRRGHARRLELCGVSWDDAQARLEGGLRALSDRLGQGAYFFGDAPRSLDAAVYAHLASINARAGEDAAQALLRRHANLLAFCERVRAAYFAEHSGSDAGGDPALPAAQSRVRPDEVEEPALPALRKRNPEREEASRRSNRWLLSVGAVAAMYILWSDAWLYEEIEDASTED